MSGVWKRSHARTSEAPPDERGGNRYVRPTATAPHSDSTVSPIQLASLSRPLIASCAEQCGLDVVITSKAFLERFPNMTIPGRTLLLEDALVSPQLIEKLSALALAWLMPTALLKRALGAHRIKPMAELVGSDTTKASPMDDLATVIFSSGSTGDPKGVMLSHFNVMSNISQVSQVFMLSGRDKILGILPFFHSFGFTAGLWLPAVQGVGVVFHPNPLDAQVIGGLVEKYKVTFLIATPTFLQAYMRRCTPENFGSLQYVLAGAEKLPERVASAFEDQFGIRPLEGYGCTECSPVVTVNARDFRAPGYRQVATKRGRIGHPLPGVAPVAMQQGRFAAETIEARLRRGTPKPFHYHDKGSLAVIGRSSAIAQIGRFKLHGYIAWLLWLFVHLMYIVEFSNRLIIFIRWGIQYVTFSRGARLITGQESEVRSQESE